MHFTWSSHKTPAGTARPGNVGWAVCPPTLACFVGIVLDLRGDPASVSFSSLSSAEACEKPGSPQVMRWRPGVTGKSSYQWGLRL